MATSTPLDQPIAKSDAPKPGIIVRFPLERRNGLLQSSESLKSARHPANARLPGVQNGAARHGRLLLEFLRSHRDLLSPLLILTHDFPDPDALAAACGLQHLAKTSFGIEAKIAYRGQVGRMENRTMVRLLQIPIYRFKTSLLQKALGGVALVDTQPAFTNNPLAENRRVALVIDQHPSIVTPNADLAIVDTQCGATCVLVAQALLQNNQPIPARIATALAYGILTDTLDLYRVRRQDVVDTYLQVLQHADMRLLGRIQNPPRPRKFFSTLSKGISEARSKQGLVVTHLGLVDSPDRVAQVAEFLLTYRRARWVLATGRHKQRFHASLRAVQNNVDAGSVLRVAFEYPESAGGHGPIAGGSCQLPTKAAEEARRLEQLLVTRIMKRLRMQLQTPLCRTFDV